MAGVDYDIFSPETGAHAWFEVEEAERSVDTCGCPCIPWQSQLDMSGNTGLELQGSGMHGANRSPGRRGGDPQPPPPGTERRRRVSSLRKYQQLKEKVKTFPELVRLKACAVAGVANMPQP